MDKLVLTAGIAAWILLFVILGLTLAGCEPIPEHPCVEYATYSCDDVRSRFYGAKWGSLERKQLEIEYSECKAAALLKCMQEGKDT